MFLVLGTLLTGLATFALVAYPDTDPATEAAMKFFVFASVTGAIMIFGLSYWFGAAGSTLLADLPGMDTMPMAVLLGFVAVVVGLGYKASLVPFHFWAPDAYEGGPLSIAAYLSVVPKIGALFALAQVVRDLPPESGWTAIIAGLALALSSTAIVMQLLIEQKQAAQPVGRAALSVLLFQDILVAPILIFVGFANIEAGQDVTKILLEALFNGVIAIIVIVIIGRFGLRHMFRLAAAAGGRDFLMALTLLTVVGAAAITATAGLSLALGAFLAGLLLGETEFKHQTEVDLEPFKGILLGLFFMTVGMGLDLPSILSQPWVILSGLGALLVLKLVIGFGALRLFAGPTPMSIEAAFLLAPAGEFAFVVIAAATAIGVLAPEPAGLMAAIAGLSMLLIPVLGKVGGFLSDKLAGPEPAHTLEEDFSNLQGHVIIAGFGRVGHAVARILAAEDAEVVALERSTFNVSRARNAGWRAYLGDAARPEILHSAGVDGAMMFVVTVDDVTAAEAMVSAFHKLRPDAPIIARARDHEHARRLIDAGARSVIPDAIESGLQMAGRTLHEFGYNEETIRDRLAAERDEEYERAAI